MPLSARVKSENINHPKYFQQKEIGSQGEAEKPEELEPTQRLASVGSPPTPAALEKKKEYGTKA